MLTMESTLLIGPYDWDSERMPKEEFLERIRDFWQRVRDPGCIGAIVWGDHRNHAELAYLTNLVPKLNDSLALLPRRGEPILLMSGGAHTRVPAIRQTWLKLQPLNDHAKAVAQWVNELKISGRNGHAALIGGEYMRSSLYRQFAEALGAGTPSDHAAAVLRSQMRHKRPRELAAISEACAMLKATATALADAKRLDIGVTAAIVQAEHAAYFRGAQDVRTLFSLDGGRTLRPFTTPIDKVVDPLQVYFAVRHLGYWAEGFLMLTTAPNAALAKASEALKTVLPGAKAETPYRELARLAIGAVRPFGEHPITAGSTGNAIGLFLEEEPRLLADSDEKLEAGCVYSVRVGASDGNKRHAIASAMVSVKESGNDILWSSP